MRGDGESAASHRKSPLLRAAASESGGERTRRDRVNLLAGMPGRSPGCACTYYHIKRFFFTHIDFKCLIVDRIQRERRRGHSARSRLSLSHSLRWTERSSNAGE